MRSTTETTAFFDTNILLYARLGDDAGKQARAAQMMIALSATDRGYISTQVLAEMFDTLVRRLGVGSRFHVLEHVHGTADAFRVLPTGPQVSLMAAEVAARRGLRIYDALIWASAWQAGLPVVLSEDFAHRQEIEGVTFLNPFASDFELAEIGC
ncbi:MAG: PIN domain-containing protein [Coriobacteriia bacterium]|nr:PIN domain-containing protein [Coriobacteriia bacterium]